MRYSRNTESFRHFRNINRLWGALGIILCAVTFLTGCSPTYPKEKFRESIIKVCKAEYKLDVKVETIGRTIAIYLPLEDLIDFTFAITKQASEKINDVILSVSRVALSTDAEFDFYCVIAHDVRIPEIQIVIIKSVDDVKRFLLNDISRGEYSKRMLVDIRFSPQAQKEREIKEIFNKVRVDKKWQEQVMNDFFRSEPTALSDIGYWGGHFYIKDISLAEFLAEQIANRFRLAFREEKGLLDAYLVKSSKGSFTTKGGQRIFKLELLVEYKPLEVSDKKAASDVIFETALKIASHVIHNYRFNDFDRFEILNQQDNSVITLSSEELESFRTKKLKLEEITERVK
ncbi:MAG: hypothetical protein HZA30_04975 [Candidatus Omnitrophica bacterium]|nr:hypothetical protein [Candidatus Omnitrophota bacterium]